MKNKKILLTLGTLATITTPVVAVVSCGSKKEAAKPALPPAPAPTLTEEQKFDKDLHYVFPETMPVILEILDTIKSNNFDAYINNLAHKFEEAAKITDHEPIFGKSFDIKAIRGNDTEINKIVETLNNVVTKAASSNATIGQILKLLDLKAGFKALLESPHTLTGLAKFIDAINLDNIIPLIRSITKETNLQGMIANLLKWNKVDDNADMSLIAKIGELITPQIKINGINNVDIVSGEHHLLSETINLDSLQGESTVYAPSDINYGQAPSARSHTRSAASHVRAASADQPDLMELINDKNIMMFLSGLLARLFSYDFMNDWTGSDGSTIAGLLTRVNHAMNSLTLHRKGESGLYGGMNPFSYIDWNIASTQDDAKKAKYADFIQFANTVPEMLDFFNSDAAYKEHWKTWQTDKRTVGTSQLSEDIIAGYIKGYIGDLVNEHHKTKAEILTLMTDYFNSTATTNPNTGSTLTELQEVENYLFEAIGQYKTCISARTTNTLDSTAQLTLLKSTTNILYDLVEKTNIKNTVEKKVAKFTMKASALIPLKAVSGTEKPFVKTIIDQGALHEQEITDISFKDLAQAYEVFMLTGGILQIVEEGLPFKYHGIYSFGIQFQGENPFITMINTAGFPGLSPNTEVYIGNEQKKIADIFTAASGAATIDLKFDTFINSFQEVWINYQRIQDSYQFMMDSGFDEATSTQSNYLPLHVSMKKFVDKIPTYKAFLDKFYEYAEVMPYTQFSQVTDAATWSQAWANPYMGRDDYKHANYIVDTLNMKFMDEAERTRFAALKTQDPLKYSDDDKNFVIGLAIKAGALYKTKRAEMITLFNTEKAQTNFSTDMLSMLSTIVLLTKEEVVVRNYLRQALAAPQVA